MNKHSHKEFNEAAYIEEHRGAQPIHLGRISSSKAYSDAHPNCQL